MNGFWVNLIRKFGGALYKRQVVFFFLSFSFSGVEGIVHGFWGNTSRMCAQTCIDLVVSQNKGTPK